MPLPGPGSCAELTGPLLGCWRTERERGGAGGGGGGVGGVRSGKESAGRPVGRGWRREEGGRGARQITQRL